MTETTSVRAYVLTIIHMPVPENGTGKIEMTRVDVRNGHRLVGSDQRPFNYHSILVRGTFFLTGTRSMDRTGKFFYACRRNYS